MSENQTVKMVVIGTADLGARIHDLVGQLQQGSDIVRAWCGLIEDDPELYQTIDKEIEQLVPTVEKLAPLVRSLKKDILLKDAEIHRRQEKVPRMREDIASLVKYILEALLYMLLPFLLIPFVVMMNHKLFDSEHPNWM